MKGIHARRVLVVLDEAAALPLPTTREAITMTTPDEGFHAHDHLYHRPGRALTMAEKIAILRAGLAEDHKDATAGLDDYYEGRASQSILEYVNATITVVDLCERNDPTSVVPILDVLIAALFTCKATGPHTHGSMSAGVCPTTGHFAPVDTEPQGGV